MKLKQKHFHFICIAVMVGLFIWKAVVEARSSIYILSGEQFRNMVIIAIIPLVWMYEKIKGKECAEEIKDMMTAWYLGFALAFILMNGIANIQEKDRLGREAKANMTEEEWEKMNDQIKEGARQDYYEYRHP